METLPLNHAFLPQNQAWRPLWHLVSYLMVVQLQFALLFLLLMGSKEENLHHIGSAYVLLLAYLVDYTADYEEFVDAKRDTYLTLISYWVFVAFMYFFFLNFFLGIVSMAFEEAGENVRQKVTISHKKPIAKIYVFSKF